MSRPDSIETVSSPVEKFEQQKPVDVESAPDVPVAPTKNEKNRADVAVRPAFGHNLKNMTEAERQEYLSDTVIAGEQKYHQLGWIQLVVVLIVEAIALGALSLPR